MGRGARANHCRARQVSRLKKPEREAILALAAQAERDIAEIAAALPPELQDGCRRQLGRLRKEVAGLLSGNRRLRSLPPGARREAELMGEILPFLRESFELSLAERQRRKGSGNRSAETKAEKLDAQNTIIEFGLEIFAVEAKRRGLAGRVRKLLLERGDAAGKLSVRQIDRILCQSGRFGH
jgi:hypothetical protein